MFFPTPKLTRISRKTFWARAEISYLSRAPSEALDKPLYSLVFPNVSVIVKSSCRDVEHAVSGIRDAADLHWLRAFGVVDNDRRTQADVNRLKERGVYAVSVFSVESIYYHSEVQRRVVERHAAITGEVALTHLAAAKAAAIAAITPHVQRLSERAVEKAIREEIFRHLPKKEEIATAAPIEVFVDVAAVVVLERDRLQNAVNAGDLMEIIAKYPVRETPALAKIALGLGFQDREQYEGAVRKLLIDDNEALSFVRTLFGSLASDIGAT